MATATASKDTSAAMDSASVNGWNDGEQPPALKKQKLLSKEEVASLRKEYISYVILHIASQPIGYDLVFVFM